MAAGFYAPLNDLMSSLRSHTFRMTGSYQNHRLRREHSLPWPGKTAETERPATVVEFLQQPLTARAATKPSALTSVLRTTAPTSRPPTDTSTTKISRWLDRPGTGPLHVAACREDGYPGERGRRRSRALNSAGTSPLRAARPSSGPEERT